MYFCSCHQPYATQVDLLQQRLTEITTAITPTTVLAEQLEALRASQTAVQDAVERLVVQEGDVAQRASLAPVLETLEALAGMG